MTNFARHVIGQLLLLSNREKIGFAVIVYLAAIVSVAVFLSLVMRTPLIRGDQRRM